MTYRSYLYRRYRGSSGNVMPYAQIEVVFGRKPIGCPFCHNPYPELVCLRNDRAYRMDCEHCGCKGPEGRDPNEAITFWDLRDPPTYPAIRQ